MRRTFKIPLTILLGLEALFLLLPTTLTYLIGMPFFIVASFTGYDGRIDWELLGVVALLMFPGYGLFSLWWLIVKHRTIFLRDVPKFIWVGLSIGSLAATLFMWELIFSPSSARSISAREDVGFTLWAFGGPLLVTVTVVALIWQRPTSGPL